jgi:thiol:disulfide interchange protein
MARTELWDRSSQRALPVWLPIAVALLILARVISSRFAVTATFDLVRWVPSDRAERLAAATHKPLLYEFSAEWCGPCHQMEAEVFRDSKLATLINERFIPVKLVDRQRETGRNPPDVARLQSLYNVNAFPTIIVVRAGRAPETVLGYPGKSRFEQFLRGTH